MAPPQALFLQQKMRGGQKVGKTQQARGANKQSMRTMCQQHFVGAYRKFVHVICLCTKARNHTDIASLHKASASEIFADICCRLFVLLYLGFVLNFFSL